ncbi:MAG: T9SS type A sorting domain-containing protein [Calditrichaeota bacterium]|nr:T9SS type A sorting domain-containing protein [Calditrichota bacterium]
MKGSSHQLIALLALAVCIVALVANLWGQTTLKISPENLPALTGRPCSLNVVVDNVQNLGAFQFDLLYASEVVHATSAAVGPFPGSTGRTVVPLGPQIDNGSRPGRLTFGAATFGVNQGPDGTGALATVVFSPQATGQTALLMENVQLADIYGHVLPIATVIGGRIVVGSPCLVTTTADSGIGSLRFALAYANDHPGPDTIRFNIPPTDPGCDSTGVCTIYLTQSLQLSDSGTVIDGYTQSGASPNSNPFGQPINASLKVVLDGSLSESSCILVLGANNLLRGLVLSRLDRGIECIGERARGNRIEGSFIGTDATGSAAWGNRTAGVSISTYASMNVIGGAQPAARNLISGNSCAVAIGPWGNNIIQGNYIGTDATGLSPLGNTIGVRIVNVSQRNLIGGPEDGMQNLIAFNQTGILIDGSFGEAYYNTISRNSIHSNAGKGIGLMSGGNQNFPAPVITSVTPTQASGSSVPFATVELFSDAGGQGAVFEGTTAADGAGNWVLSKPGGFAGPYLTATATDPHGNTSEFSAPVATAVGPAWTAPLPTSFFLHPVHPNPLHTTTLIRYGLPRPAQVELAIYNTAGQRVRTLFHQYQAAGVHSLSWDGTDHRCEPVPSGVYFCCFRADEFSATRKIAVVR